MAQLLLLFTHYLMKFGFKIMNTIAIDAFFVPTIFGVILPLIVAGFSVYHNTKRMDSALSDIKLVNVQQELKIVTLEKEVAVLSTEHNGTVRRFEEKMNHLTESIDRLNTLVQSLVSAKPRTR